MADAMLVAGDFVFDYHIYEGRRRHYGDGSSPGVRIVPQAGGAALVYELLRELLGQRADWSPHEAIRRPPQQDVDEAQRAYAFWRPYPRKAAPEKQVWRVSEAMGFGAANEASPAEAWPRADGLPDRPRAIVLSEGGMGFRQNEGSWRDLPLASAEWIVLKTAAPLAQGALWKTLTREHHEKLIVLVSAHELRKSAARLSTGLSWDATLEDLLRELRPGGALEPLTLCRHLLVTFESEGGLWLDLAKERRRGRFVYDPAAVEGEHAPAEGTAFGLLSCLAAAVAWQLTLDAQSPDFAAALEGGLSAMRDLLDKGHGPVYDQPKGFPAARLARVIKDPVHRYARAAFDVPDAAADGPAWSIVLESQRREPEALVDLARLVVRHGPIALHALPHLNVGKFLTVDRHEIEALRTLAQVIRRYQQHDDGSKPLSIGVFGPPGAGKSFAVRQLADQLPTRLGVKVGWLVFNLSQFDTPADLIGAFHQVRDQALDGKLPIAFFDEFDSQNYRWLQYLLAPMQDGKFQEGQLTHPLGKCLLIFAGGTSWSFETFGPPRDGGDEAHRAFRLAKGPDFKSRLDAYYDVAGPNRRKVSPPPKNSDPKQHEAVSGHAFGDDANDIYLAIRRALMIRAELKCGQAEKLEPDEGLLCALLGTEKYTHGSRSLGKILQPLQGSLLPSRLPPPAQLRMHTEDKRFIDLLAAAARPTIPEPLSEADVETMAPAVHETWREEQRKKTGDPGKDFQDMDPFKRDSNRAAARRMPGLLALVGLRLMPDVADRAAEQAISEYLEYHLELLAEAEHDGWMRWHLSQGWRYAPKRDDAQKLHNCLVPFAQLSDADKNKDRASVRNYPAFARRAGKHIERVPR